MVRNYLASPGSGGRLDDPDGEVGLEFMAATDTWVYDGSKDPLLVRELTALLKGEVPAYAQSIDGVLDPTVHARVTGGEVRPEIVRVLEAGAGAPDGAVGEVSAEWHSEEAGEEGVVCGVFVVVRGS